MKTSLTFAIFCAILAQDSARGEGAGEIQERNVDLKDGTRIHLLESGRPSAAPVLVFIPGWTLPAFLWNEQIRKFSTDRLVLAIDPRSQGDSSKTAAGNTPEQRARDLQEILSIRQIASAVLVGWSQGANDVAAYVQQFGTGSIAGVVFVDSPVSAGPAEIEINRKWSEQFFGMLGVYAGHPDDYCEGMVRSIFKKPHSEIKLEQVIAHREKLRSIPGYRC